MATQLSDAGIQFADNSILASAANSFSFRNRIINGDMRIDQRNSGAAVTVTTQTYFLDRFYSANSTGTGTITAQQSTLSGARSFRLTATAAVTALTTTLLVHGVSHIIEAQNVFDLNGKTVTFSFTVETNWSGNLPIAVVNSAYTRSYVVDAAVTSGTNKVTVTIPLEAASVATNTNAVGLIIVIGFNNEATFRTATTGSWIAAQAYVSTSSTQWAKTIDNFINVTNVQLEVGSTATPFEHRPIGLELSLCQRYFWRSGTIRQYAYGTTNNVIYPVYLPVEQRGAPTVTVQSNISLTLGTIRQVGAGVEKTGSATAFSNLYVAVRNTEVLTGADDVSFIVNATAEL